MKNTNGPSAEALELTGRTWARMQHTQCVGWLYMALRYDATVSQTHEYVKSMADRAWVELGQPLQCDLAQALAAFRANCQ